LGLVEVYFKNKGDAKQTLCLSSNTSRGSAANKNNEIHQVRARATNMIANLASKQVNTNQWKFLAKLV